MISKRRQCVCLTAAILIISLMIVATIELLNCSKSPPNSRKSDIVSSSYKRPEKSDEFLYAGTASDDIYLLARRQVPDILHFVWCRPNGTSLEFNNYLTIVSAQRFLRPSKVLFHFAYLPQIDWAQYNQWFGTLQAEMPHLVLNELRNKSQCIESSARKLTIILRILERRGGIYLPEDHIVTEQFSREILAEDRLIIQSVADSHPLILARGAVPLPVEEFRTFTSTESCVLARDFAKASNAPCAYLDRKLFPVDIWDASGEFSELARSILYGDSRPLRPQPDSRTLIPLIAHYVWMGGVEMNFLAFLSIKSALNVLAAEAVLIHGNAEPGGQYWDELSQEKRVHFVYRELPETIFGQEVRDYAHVSDIVRLDVLLRYGGVYTDWDAVWVKSINDLRAFEAVATVDWPDWHPPFPDKFNMGVFIAKPNAPFLRYFLDSMRDFRDGVDSWYYNPVLMPYKVYEQHPDSLRLDRHLQVICFELHCHPTWIPGYHNANFHHESGASFDWRQDVYAIHWTAPTPAEFADENALRSSQTMFADVGKFILDFGD